MRLAIPPPRSLARERPQLRPQRRVILSDDRLAPLCRARLTDISARPPLRDPQTVLQHADRPAPARRAHQFPFAISFNAWFSRTWSATIRLSRVFSASSSFNRFTSSAFIPPN